MLVMNTSRFITSLFRKQRNQASDAMNQAILMAASVAAAEHVTAEDRLASGQATAGDAVIPPATRDATGRISTKDTTVHQNSEQEQETPAADASEEEETASSEADLQQVELAELPPGILLAQSDIPAEDLPLEDAEGSPKKKDDEDDLPDSSMGPTAGFMNILLAGLGLGTVAAVAGGGGRAGDQEADPHLYPSPGPNQPVAAGDGHVGGFVRGGGGAPGGLVPGRCGAGVA